jgi:hypothetical protein
MAPAQPSSTHCSVKPKISYAVHHMVTDGHYLPPSWQAGLAVNLRTTRAVVWQDWPSLMCELASVAEDHNPGASVFSLAMSVPSTPISAARATW